MLAGLEQRMKGGLGRLRQVVRSGLGYIISGPTDSDFRIESAAGRSLTLASGDSTAASNLAFSVGNSSNSSAAGTMTFTGGGNSTATGSGGGFTFTGGTPIGANGSGGGFTFTGGNSASSSGSGGGFTFLGGIAYSAPQLGGPINFEAGQSIGAGSGASINFKPGAGASRNGMIQLDGGRGAALSTAATGGFVTMPTCAGAPSGVPNASDIPTGSVAMVVDTTNLRAYFYIAGTWRYAQLT